MQRECKLWHWITLTTTVWRCQRRNTVKVSSENQLCTTQINSQQPEKPSQSKDWRFLLPPELEAMGNRSCHQSTRCSSTKRTRTWRRSWWCRPSAQTVSFAVRSHGNNSHVHKERPQMQKLVFENEESSTFMVSVFVSVTLQAMTHAGRPQGPRAGKMKIQTRQDHGNERVLSDGVPHGLWCHRKRGSSGHRATDTKAHHLHLIAFSAQQFLTAPRKAENQRLREGNFTGTRLAIAGAVWLAGGLRFITRCQLCMRWAAQNLINTYDLWYFPFGFFPSGLMNIAKTKEPPKTRLSPVSLCQTI